MILPTYAQSSFLQSQDWEAFKRTVGHAPVRVGNTLALTHRLGGPLTYAFLPRTDADEALFDALATRGYVFVRVEGKIHTQRTVIATKHRLPETTLLLDLSLPEDALLAQMHSKTRYNIRLAERKGVTIRAEKDVDVFFQLNEETTSRDGFKSHDKAYYAAFIDMPMCTQYTAYVDDMPIAAVLCVSYAGTTTYVHGASSNKKRNTMAPYLLQWHAICAARANGDTQYDFWGIAPPYTQSPGTKETCYNGYSWDVSHPWTGITRFKVGFGGRVITYPPAVDVVLKPALYKWYTFIYRMRYGRT